MPRSKKEIKSASKSQSRRIAAQKRLSAPEFDEDAQKVTKLRLERLKIERIYYPEDFPHDSPDPREDPEGFTTWAKKYYKLS